MWQILTNVSEGRTASIFTFRVFNQKMEAVFTSKTSANVYQTTWRHITGDSNVRSHCHENLRAEIFITIIIIIIIIQGDA
jgi:serine/threonine-protein kinase RIO1